MDPFAQFAASEIDVAVSGARFHATEDERDRIAAAVEECRAVLDVGDDGSDYRAGVRRGLQLAAAIARRDAGVCGAIERSVYRRLNRENRRHKPG